MCHRDRVLSSEWSANIVRFLQHIGCNKIVPAGPCEPRSNVDAEKASSASIKDYWKGDGRQLKLKGKYFPKKSFSSDKEIEMHVGNGIRTLERENLRLKETIEGKD